MTAIVDSNGKYLFSIRGTDEVIALNTPQGCLAVDDPPSPNMYYGSQFGWVAMPVQTIPNAIFDYETRQWVDTRSLEQVKEQKWDEIKSLRDQIEFGGFEYEGNTYDSGQVSQGRIMAATISGLPQTWTTKDNLVSDITATEFKELYLAMQNHVSDVHERGRLARLKIEEATTVDEVDKITL